MKNKRYINVFNESHPELVFWFLNGKKDLINNKKSNDGILERLNILSKYDSRVFEIYNLALRKYLRKDVKKDDIIDAIALALSAYLSNNNLKGIPIKPEKDNFEIEMKIVYYEP